MNNSTLTHFSQPGSPVTSTQMLREERTEGSGIIFQTEEEAIAKRNENQNVLDIRDQVEILQKHLDTVKDTGEAKEVNKCMTQLMNLREKYAEITGGISIYESPAKSPIMEARRNEGRRSHWR